MLILKRHYSYVQLRKEILDLLEDLMTQDSLVGSTVTTRSKKENQLSAECPFPVLSQSTLRLPTHPNLENQRKLQRCQSITHHWTSIPKTVFMLSCQSQTLKVTDKKSRGNMKVMRIDQTL
jgi:hypothetical protein